MQNEENNLESPTDFRPSQFGKGTEIFFTDNTKLAACLIAVGFSLRTDPAYTYEEKGDGRKAVKWLLKNKSDDGMYSAVELLKYWREDTDFLDRNPDHPFAIAMSAVKSTQAMNDHLRMQTPYVCFKFGKRKLYVKKGSRKHQKAISEGRKQV
jgi:hypothetical protein